MALKRLTKVLKRPWARKGILLLLGLWTLAPLAALLHPVAFVEVHEIPSEVEVHRIDAPSASPPPVCHHHPQGCPADCHCPKVVPEKSADAVPVAGALREPALVQCTEGQAKANGSPVMMVLWLPEVPTPLVGIAFRPAWPSGCPSPLDPLRDTPWHVPRATSSSA